MGRAIIAVVLRIEVLDPADDSAIAAACEVLSECDRELFGDLEPPRSTALQRSWLAPMAGRVRHAWLADDGTRPVGFAALQLRNGSGNDHLGWVREFVVTPDARRQGIGRALLDRLCATASDGGRTLLALRHAQHDVAASTFADAIGMSEALRVDQRRLELARGVMPVARAELPSGLEFVAWDGHCPDDLIDAYCAAHEFMHDAPRPPSTNAWRVTADEVRAYETVAAAHGGEHWVVGLRRIGASALLGYSEVYFEPGEPWLARQGDTGIDPRWRRRGLGRALKLVNLRRLVRERPDVRTVETFNASDNTGMIALNDSLGFRLATRWQERELALR